ncbi:hypothetical protein BpHYR1_047733 [Brachionus plicatilis]|uniref:Uncharacterized protein n=1 Tax=Brachionus plicatilis TaxID=10195 RepID=A0A3M7PMD9_BRAPC|nr:hypothetical protein BpHYR1_047733 [Brachionus plicatilis]
MINLIDVSLKLTYRHRWLIFDPDLIPKLLEPHFNKNENFLFFVYLIYSNWNLFSTQNTTNIFTLVYSDDLITVFYEKLPYNLIKNNQFICKYTDKYGLCTNLLNAVKKCFTCDNQIALLGNIKKISYVRLYQNQLINSKFKSKNSYFQMSIARFSCLITSVLRSVPNRVGDHGQQHTKALHHVHTNTCVFLETQNQEHKVLN